MEEEFSLVKQTRLLSTAHWPVDNARSGLSLSHHLLTLLLAGFEAKIRVKVLCSKSQRIVYNLDRRLVPPLCQPAV